MDNTTSSNPFNFQDYFVVDPISAQAIALPIFCLIAILINIVPFLALSSGSRINISACSLIIYIFLANVFTLINSLLWPTNDYANWFSGIGLCDIETKLQFPIITGIAAATACLTRELAGALDTKSAKVTSTRRDRRNKIIIDSLLCFALPTLQIILHWLVQDVRFFLAVLAGCGASYDASWPTVVIMYIWPVIFSLLSCIYSGLMIYRILLHRRNLPHVIGSGGSSSFANTSAFIRLLLLALTVVFIYTPISIYFFYENVDIQYFPYSYDEIHNPATSSLIIQLPYSSTFSVDRWTTIAMAFFIFVYFGASGRALEIYSKTLLFFGAGKIWPSLRTERRPPGTGTNSKGSWFTKYSPITKLSLYFEKNSEAWRSRGSSSGLQTERKDSAIPLTTHNTSLAQNIRLGSVAISAPITSPLNQAPTGTPPSIAETVGVSEPYDHESDNLPDLVDPLDRSAALNANNAMMALNLALAASSIKGQTDEFGLSPQSKHPRESGVFGKMISSIKFRKRNDADANEQYDRDLELGNAVANTGCIQTKIWSANGSEKEKTVASEDRGKSNSSTPDGVTHGDLEDLDDEEGSVRVKTQMRMFSEHDIERVAGGEAGENEGGRMG